MQYKIGIEYEYMLTDFDGNLRYFNNLEYNSNLNFLNVKNKTDAIFLRNNHMKNGYWYMEGDERFKPDGSFLDFKIKGIEIRTPPRDSVDAGISFLLKKEGELKQILNENGFKLAIAGHNPFVDMYNFNPPLNNWEQAMRETRAEYQYAEISTVTYGPDVNLSFKEYGVYDLIDKVEKLIFYAPYIIPFSFSSPFSLAKKWAGCSRRTWQREAKRPTCKVYFDQNLKITHPAVYASINKSEHGRIEFKAFDAIPMLDVFYGCCYLLIGILLDNTLPGRNSLPDSNLYKKVALSGFTDKSVYNTCDKVINHAIEALECHGLQEGVKSITILLKMLKQKICPSDVLLTYYEKTGEMFFPCGLAENIKMGQIL